MTAATCACGAIAELTLAVETGGDVDQAVQAAYIAGVEPYEIAELGGLPMRQVLETLGPAGGLIKPPPTAGRVRRRCARLPPGPAVPGQCVTAKWDWVGLAATVPEEGVKTFVPRSGVSSEGSPMPSIASSSLTPAPQQT